MKSDLSGGDGNRIVAEINMIPLIDVSLVLLIIFMILTPFLVRSQIKVNLPAAGAQPKEPDSQPLNIQITKQGVVYIDNAATPPEALEETLRRVIPNPESQVVVIEADKETVFDAVVQVMDAAKKLGVSKLGIGVRQKKSNAP